MTDLECFRATVEHRRPERVLCYAGFTDDLKGRVVAHTGTEDLTGYYGMADLGGLSIARPDDLPQEPGQPVYCALGVVETDAGEVCR